MTPENKKILIYGLIGTAVIGGVYYVWQLRSSAANAAANAASNAASQQQLYDQSVAASSGTSSSGGGTAPVLTLPGSSNMAGSSTSDIAALLGAITPLFANNNNSQQSNQDSTTAGLLTAFTTVLGNIFGSNSSNSSSNNTSNSSGGALTSAQATADVNNAYSTFLGRSPGAGDNVSAWVTSLTSGSLTLGQVDNSIANSPEGQITKLYEGLLGRTPDVGGLNTWESVLNSGGTIADVQKGITGSQEYLALHPAAQTGSNSTAGNSNSGTDAAHTSNVSIGISAVPGTVQTNTQTITPALQKLAAAA